MWDHEMAINLCACMGVVKGDSYCYCELERRGLSTKHLEWTEQEKKELHEALNKFKWRQDEPK